MYRTKVGNLWWGIYCVVLLGLTILFIYKSLIVDFLNNDYSYGNFLALVLVSIVAFVNGLILLFLEFYLKRSQGEFPDKPKVTLFTPINIISIIASLKANVSPFIIPSLYWKYIITIVTTAIKSPIATAKRNIFFILSNKPIFDAPFRIIQRWIKTVLEVSY